MGDEVVGAARDMITTVRLRLTVKPMLRKSVKRAEPMSWGS